MPAVPCSIGVTTGADFATARHGETVRFCLAIHRDRQGGPSHPILPAPPWTAAQLRDAVEPYYQDHRQIRLDPEARNLKHTLVVFAEDRKSWTVHQTLVDPDGHNDWSADVTVDLEASRLAREPRLQLLRLGPVGS